MLLLSATLIATTLVAPVQVSSPRPMPIRIPAVTSIKIERTPCFGTCPVYKATLVPNGDVTYFGERYVPKLGSWKGRASDVAFRRLSRLSEKLGFFRLKNSYSAPITDLPTTIVTITRGANVKRVSCYGEEPDEFWILALAIDSVLKQSESGWEQVKPKG